MASLKEIRTRITSVNSTKQITSAMKMVSAAKLKKAQDRIMQMRPYANKLSEVLSNLSGTMAEMESKFVVEREVKRVLLVPVTSNRGLCGGFNSNVIKATGQLIREEYANCEVTILPVGKKAFDWFKKSELLYSGSDMVAPSETGQVFDDLTFENSSNVCEPIMDAFSAEQFDKVVVIYNQFKNAATQYVQTEQLLPVVAPNGEENSKVDFIFQPNKEELLENLIPTALKTQFYKALLDSNASEHGARMTAMHKATDNAEELLGDLRLTYNKARQAAITTEILEIVGGAEALEG
jgi:F-type H+-transporting ATPase subunit gamma